MRAAIDARVSTERQGREQTIASQLTPLREWVQAQGHELLPEHVFTDAGYSGSRLDRPGLDRLRDAVQDAAVDIVAVLSPDRLARTYAYQVRLLEEFRRQRCEVVFRHQPLADTPSDQLLLPIQGAVAEYERALLGERFRRGKLQKAREGHFIGGRAPYGYRYVPKRDGVPGHLVVDEAEAAFVRMLDDWLVEERLTVRQILKRLNAGPWLPRAGKRPWSAAVVHHILTDPVYVGTAYTNRYRFVPPESGAADAETPVEPDAAARSIGPGDTASSAALAVTNETRFDWLGAHGRPPREAASPSDCWAADYRVSTTDADATVLNLKNGGPRLGYHTHYLVDGGKARLVLNVLVTPAEVKENEPFLDLFRQARFRWHLRPRQVTGDSKYGTTEIVAALEQQGIHAYMPLPAPNPRQGLYPKEAFAYDAAQDLYVCPQGTALARHHVTATERVVHYRAPAATCNACPCKDRCTTGDQGRTVRRQFDEDYLDRVRAYRGTAPYEKALRKRGVWVEPLFAEAKDWHGFRRFRLRGLEKVNREALLVAAGQNLKRLLSKRGWGRRPWPGGAIGLRLELRAAPAVR